MKRLLALVAAAVVSLSATAGAELTVQGLDKNQYTSDFMIGSVAVSVIFVESNGAIDPNRETWSDARKTQVLSKIMAGLDWWTKQNPKSPLSFTVVSQTLQTSYEPITRSYTDESLWIPEIMAQLGQTGSRFSSVRAYDNEVRREEGTDWAYTVFVVDSLNDVDGKFTDGMFAYTYLGGPYTVMTYDNNGYGISNMDVVFAHESGHIFNALDEYAGASGPTEYSNGYQRVINGNHAYASTANDATSIMRGGINWGLDKWARQMVGWFDNDGNGRDDIMDRTPDASFASVASVGAPTFAGHAEVNVLPRQNNAQGAGMTVDTIAKVEYRLRNGTWALANPVDGRFDSGSENFTFNFGTGDLSVQAISAQDVDVRVTTVYSAANGGGGNANFASAGLSSAHAFPNPFKPNAALGHTVMHFTGFPAGSKIQVFTPSGEPVFEKQTDSTAITYDWPVVNDDGQQLASGVYLYLITSADGDTKKGKIAVVR